jgi:hypothetical protein
MDDTMSVARPNPTLARTALNRAATTLVRYYAALQLSAGAATEVLPIELQPDRPPIVRSSHTALPGGFDRREIIVRSGRSLVITVDVARAQHRDSPVFSSN